MAFIVQPCPGENFAVKKEIPSIIGPVLNVEKEIPYMEHRKTWSSPKCFLVLSLALVAGGSLQAQEQPTYLVPVEMKGQRLQGSVGVAQHENDGAIGVVSKGTEAGHRVETVRPGGPAATAGILTGDVVVALDGASVKGLDTSEVTKAIAQKKAGEKIELTINRNGETKTLTVVVDTRKHLFENDPAYQNQSKLPPAVTQLILGGSAQITARLAQTPDLSSYVRLDLFVQSKDAPAFEVDDRKFFVLDGTRKQLRHISLDEIKYDIQSNVAKNWRGTDYPPPPPPPPQQQYTITGVERGNYTITNFGGGMASISGTSTGTYTATPQQDNSQLGNQLGYAIGIGIRRHFDTKSNQKLLEEAKKEIATWEGSYFQGQAPMVAGEKRSGGIAYWTGSDRKVQPPYRVVLFFTDPRTQKQESVTFAFGTGAEKIRDEIESQKPATSSETKTPSETKALANSDVVGMFKAGISAEIIVAKIKNTPCSFDTSPAALKELKDAGLTDNVILAMVQASKN